MVKKPKSSAAPNRTRQDLTGKRFVKSTVLECVKITGKASKWKCLCDCGSITYKTTGHLNANAVSCGSLKGKILQAKGLGNWWFWRKPKSVNKVPICGDANVIAATGYWFGQPC